MSIPPLLTPQAFHSPEDLFLAFALRSLRMVGRGKTLLIREKDWEKTEKEYPDRDSIPVNWRTMLSIHVKKERRHVLCSGKSIRFDFM